MQPTFFSTPWNIFAALGKLVGPVEKMALTVVAEGGKVSQRAAARGCVPDSHSPGKSQEVGEPEGKGAHLQCHTSQGFFPFLFNKVGSLSFKRPRVQEDPVSMRWIFYTA